MGKVGIGTVTPKAQLDVDKSVWLASKENAQSIVAIGDPIGGNSDAQAPINLFGSAQTG